MGMRVRDGDSGAAPKKKLGGRMADELGTADDDRMSSFDDYPGSVQLLDHPRRACRVAAR